jgi:hypothetical protein
VILKKDGEDQRLNAKLSGSSAYKPDYRIRYPGQLKESLPCKDLVVTGNLKGSWNNPAETSRI